MSRQSFGLLVFFLAAAGCGRVASAPPPTGETEQPAASAPKLKLVRPERRTIRREVEQPGRIEPFAQTPVHVKVPGFVGEVRVDIGDRVKEGQLLARLSIPETDEELEYKRRLVSLADAEVKQAQEALAAAEALVKSAEAHVAEVEAGRERADADARRWESELERDKELVKKKVIEQQTLDEVRYQAEAARAARKEVEAKVQAAKAQAEDRKALRGKADADVLAARARKSAAEAEQRRLEALVQYATVRAPFDGVVTRRHLDVGHFLQPAGDGKGEPLFVVTCMDPVRVFVEVPEADAVWVADKAPARVRIPALRNQEFRGRVTRSAWALEPRNFTLRTAIDLPNPDGRLRPGMYAFAAITLTHADVWTLPAAAVVGQGDAAYVVRVADGKAVRTPVKTGQGGDGFVEVLRYQTKPARPGEPAAWEEFTGKEEVVGENAASVSDGQAIP